MHARAPSLNLQSACAKSPSRMKSSESEVHLRRAVALTALTFPPLPNSRVWWHPVSIPQASSSSGIQIKYNEMINEMLFYFSTSITDHLIHQIWTSSVAVFAGPPAVCSVTTGLHRALSGSVSAFPTSIWRLPWRPISISRFFLMETHLQKLTIWPHLMS